MSLATGDRLGAYEILASLGAGGMGEVYRARDTRLGRDVAIKVLPADSSNDEARRRRFVQEARAASALNHPNIVTIHEIESEDGRDYIVMEYVPGRTLGAHVRQRMPLSEALRIAVAVADALARAHAAGIVHRDLKPANVVVTPDGVPKVLDFGIAKLTAPEDSGGGGDTATDETSDRFATGPGAIAGTPGYMSPEQATGGKVDARGDIFAFGCLLYEMVTGRRAFPGGSRAETLATLLRDAPKPPSEIATDVPSELERVILRCLRKEPERRFQHMADVKVELEEIRQGSTSGSAGTSDSRRGRRARRLAAAAALVAAGGAALWLAARTRPVPTPPPRVVPLTTSSGYEGWPTFSPDGTQVAFAWEGERAGEGAVLNFDIWVKIVGSSETRRITTDPAFDGFPSWSPDGRQIAFVRLEPGARAGVIRLVSPLGGADRKLTDFPVQRSRLSWSPDGRWLAVRRARFEGETGPEGSAIHLVPVLQGESRALTAHPPPGFDAHPAFSPDGQHLAYASCRSFMFPPCDLLVLDLGPGLEPKGAPRLRVRQPGGIEGIAWTRDGRSLVYSTALTGLDKGRLWRVEAEAEGAPVRVEIAPLGALAPATSLARDRLAFVLDGTDADVYELEPDQAVKPILASSFSDYFPAFSPDGTRIAFESGRSGQSHEIWLADADGANPVQLTHGPGVWQGTPAFSPDGRQVAFTSRDETNAFNDLWVIDVAGGAPRRLTDTPTGEGMPTWSRDGRFVYFREERDYGRDIARIPTSGGASERLTRQGGVLPRVSADGKTLYYARRDDMSPVFALDLESRSERQVLECAVSRSLADGPDGLYYAACPDPETARLFAPSARRKLTLFRLDPAGRSHAVGQLPAGAGFNGIAVSPRGRTVLFATFEARADLMLIEDFR